MVWDFLLVTTHYPIGTVKDYLYEQSKSGNQYSWVFRVSGNDAFAGKKLEFNVKQSDQNHFSIPDHLFWVWLYGDFGMKNLGP